MARARRREVASQSLDSLLDTMANVVGILVLILVASQIHFSAVVDQIRSEAGTRPTAEDLVLTEEAAAASRARRALLEAEWEDLESRLASARAQIDSAGGALARTRVLSDLEAELAAARGEMARVAVVLDEARATATPARRVVRLPDPRPEPQGAREVLFFCRYGRILRIDRASIMSAFERGWRNAVGAESYDFSPAEADRARVVEYFDREHVGIGPLRWRVKLERGNQIVPQLTWSNTTAGARASDIVKPDSQFRAGFARLDPSTHYIRFNVWSDSYDVYLQARRIADDKGFASGWKAFDEEIDPVLVQERERPERVD